MKWISVKERLPNECSDDFDRFSCQCYIVIRKFASMRVTLAWYMGDNMWFNPSLSNDKYRLKDVIYWMPLPEVPNEMD